jgi:hypothetical protein
MTPLNSALLPPTIFARVDRAVTTRADSESPMTCDSQDRENLLEAWDDVERTLIEWGLHPNDLDEEGITPPSQETISRACQLRTFLARQAFPPPTRVVPDVRGAVVFELQRYNSFESLHVHPDASIEHRVFQNHRLVCREIWNLESIETT